MTADIAHVDCIPAWLGEFRDKSMECTWDLWTTVLVLIGARMSRMDLRVEEN